MNRNSRLDRSVLHMARFVLEAESAFSIASGLSDGTFDNLVVRDANGLPAIPGTTIAGVLRHRLHAEKGKKYTDSLFGYQKENRNEGQASSLEVSWGVIHDSSNRPVERLQERIDDHILQKLAEDHPIFRDRVRLTHRGTAAYQGKFDRTVLPRGCRFSVEMRLWAAEKRPQQWQDLLALLKAPLLLGGSTRSGLGRFSCIRMAEKIFDLSKPDDHEQLQQTGPGLADLTGWKILWTMRQPVTADLTVELEAEDFWRFGQGGVPLKGSGKAPDALPYTEPVITWEGDRAGFNSRCVVVPGSAVRGAFRHRFLFHYSRLLLGKDGLQDTDWQQARQACDALFGHAADTEDGKTRGRAGALFFSDLYLDVDAVGRAAKHLTHSSVDRFTGGVRQGALFMEELLWNCSLRLEINLQNMAPAELPDMRKAGIAFQWVLDDLAAGRLALGAASAKGHGYFRGKVEWHHSPEWLQHAGKEENKEAA